MHFKHHPKMVDDKAREEILTEPIWKLFSKFAIPAIIAMFMYSLYSFVDAIFVGQWVGPEGIAAISIVAPLTLVNMAIAMFMGMGSASLLSRAIGANEKETISKILSSHTLFTLIFSLIYMFIGFYFAEILVGFVGGVGTILTLGASYFSIVILGAFFMNYVASSTMLIRAEGRVKVFMILVILVGVVNIILDPIFIEVLDWGIEGAAIATVISMFIAFIATLVYYLSGGSVLSYTLDGLRSAGQILKKIATVGIAGLIMQLLTVIELIFLYRSIGIYGAEIDFALMGATMNMLNFSILPMWGIAQGLQPIIGMNFGAKKYDRVKEAYKKFLLAATSIAIIIWIIFMLFPVRIIGIYLPDPSIAELGGNSFRIFMGAFLLQGFIFLPPIFFESIGKGGKASFLLSARQILLFAPLVIILPIFMGLDGIWMSIPISETLIAIISLIFIAHGLKTLGKHTPEKQKKKTEAKSSA
jgi:putative MATE family efflux protein